MSTNIVLAIFVLSSFMMLATKLYIKSRRAVVLMLSAAAVVFAIYGLVAMVVDSTNAAVSILISTALCNFALSLQGLNLEQKS